MNVPAYWKEGVAGAQVTSLKAGGPLRWFVKVSSTAELIETLAVAEAEGLRVKILGGGSNLVFADEGFDGVVIQLAFNNTRLLTVEEAALHMIYLDLLSAFEPRDQPANQRYARENKEGFLDLSESSPKQGDIVDTYRLVEMGAGVPWGLAVQWSLRNNLAGLHWYARIPCNVGGAVFNNIHGERHLLSEAVCAVEALNRETGEIRWYPHEECEFGYDRSIFQRLPLIITRVLFMLPEVSDATPYSEHYKNWTLAKSKAQPSLPNTGSVFKNLEPDEANRPVAAAWYIDHAGLKGTSVGGMQIYPTHANFIVNNGGGTQAEFLELIGTIKETVRTTYGVELECEVECIDVTGRRLT